MQLMLGMYSEKGAMWYSTKTKEISYKHFFTLFLTLTLQDTESNLLRLQFFLQLSMGEHCQKTNVTQ